MCGERVLVLLTPVVMLAVMRVTLSCSGVRFLLAGRNVPAVRGMGECSGEAFRSAWHSERSKLVVSRIVCRILDFGRRLAEALPFLSLHLFENFPPSANTWPSEET